MRGEDSITRFFGILCVPEGVENGVFFAIFEKNCKNCQKLGKSDRDFGPKSSKFVNFF